MAQELQSSGLHIYVSLKQLSSTCHVSFVAALDTDHKHKFSLTHFIHFLQTSPVILDPFLPCDVLADQHKSVKIKAIDTEAIEPEDLELQESSLERSWDRSVSKTGRYLRNSVNEDMDEFEKFVQRDVLFPVTGAFRL